MLEALLKPFIARKPAATADTQRQAARDLAARLEVEREELAAMREAHGPLLLRALAAKDHPEAAKLRDGLAAKEAIVRDLEALSATTQAAVRDLDAREAAAETARRWARARELVEQRTAAAARMQVHADGVATEAREVLRLEAAIAAALPREGWMAMGWGGHLIETLLLRYLAGRVPELFTRARGMSSIPELQEKNLVDHVRETGANALAKAPSETKPATPEGAGL